MLVRKRTSSVIKVGKRNKPGGPGHETMAVTPSWRNKIGKVNPFKRKKMGHFNTLTHGRHPAPNKKKDLH